MNPAFAMIPVTLKSPKAYRHEQDQARNKPVPAFPFRPLGEHIALTQPAHRGDDAKRKISHVRE
jgi:hypothetical protein